MLMAITGYSIFGFSFLFSKIAMNVAEPFVLLAVRFTVAVAFMSLLRIFKLVQCDLHGKDIRPLILLGLIEPVAYFLCESYGIKLTSSSFAGIIIALIPIAGIALGRIILNEHPGLYRVCYSLLSVLGVMVLTLGNDVGGFQWLGFILLLGAVFTGAMFSIQSRRVADRFTAFERTYVMFCVGMVFFDVLALIRVGGDMQLWITPLTDLSFWISIIYLACISSVGAFMLLNKALDVLDVTHALAFSNLSTVISVLAGIVLLHEHFTLIQAVGIVMVIFGVYKVNK